MVSMFVYGIWWLAWKYGEGVSGMNEMYELTPGTALNRCACVPID